VSDSDGDVELLAAYTKDELAAAITRRSTSDTKSFSLITASFAITTFFFGARVEFLGKQAPTHPLLSRWLEGVGTVAVVLAVVAALAAAAPGRVKAQNPDVLEGYVRSAAAGELQDLDLDVLNAQIDQLRKLHSSNGRKSAFLVTGMILIGIAVVSFSLYYAFYRV